MVITTVWVLVLLLLSPNGSGPTYFEAERRFESYENCMDARVIIMNALSRQEYIDSWCRPVGVVTGIDV